MSLQRNSNDIKQLLLLTRVSGIANTAISFSGIVDILNNKESNNTYFSAKASTFVFLL